MTRTPLLLALFSLAALACSNNNGPVDIGRNVGSQLADYAASWDGYAEAYAFDDGSDRIRLTLDASGHGTLIFGDAPAPPPLPLPPPLDDPNFHINDYQLTNVLPGWAYALDGAHIEDKRIQLNVDTLERFQQICATQMPSCYGDACACLPPNDRYACDSNEVCTVQNTQTGEVSAIATSKVYLCAVGVGGCHCDSTSCFAPFVGTYSLDAALGGGGTQLVGTLLLGSDRVHSDRVTIRLTHD